MTETGAEFPLLACLHCLRIRANVMNEIAFLHLKPKQRQTLRNSLRFFDKADLGGPYTFLAGSSNSGKHNEQAVRSRASAGRHLYGQS
jgi:hypothetical protein